MKPAIRDYNALPNYLRVPVLVPQLSFYVRMLNCSPAVESFGYLAFHQISIAEKKSNMTNEVKQQVNKYLTITTRTRIKYYKYMSIEERFIPLELKKVIKISFRSEKSIP